MWLFVITIRRDDGEKVFYEAGERYAWSLMMTTL